MSRSLRRLESQLVDLLEVQGALAQVNWWLGSLRTCAVAHVCQLTRTDQTVGSFTPTTSGTPQNLSTTLRPQMMEAPSSPDCEPPPFGSLGVDGPLSPLSETSPIESPSHSPGYGGYDRSDPQIGDVPWSQFESGRNLWDPRCRLLKMPSSWVVTQERDLQTLRPHQRIRRAQPDVRAIWIPGVPGIPGIGV